MFDKRDLLNIEAAMILYAVKTMDSKRNVSRRVNMSLDTIAKYIGNLEAELGSKLVITSGRGCTLTTAGEMVVFQAALIEKCLQNIYKLKIADRKIQGNIYIAYDQRMNTYLHSKAIKEISKSYPDITLCIDNCNGLPDVRNSKYDICLSYEQPKSKDLVKITSWEIPCKFFATPEYLKMHSCPKDITDLVNNHHLIVRKEDWYKLKENLVGIKSKGILFTNNMVIIDDVTASGSGIGIMPYYFHKVGKKLVSLDNIDCQITNTLYLISPQNRKDIPKVKAIINYYQDLISNL